MIRHLSMATALLSIALIVYGIASRRTGEAGDPIGAPAAMAFGDSSIDAGSRGTAEGRVVLRGAWGTQPGQFSRRQDGRPIPEAPAAIAAGALVDELTILDQVNRRVQRFRGGEFLSAFPLGTETVQDLALAPLGRIVLLDRLVDRSVRLYDSDGKLLNEAAIVGKGIPEGGGVTGVFVDEEGVYVEREYGPIVRVADSNGYGDRTRPELPGRPTRDGKLFVRAALTQRGANQLLVTAFERATGQQAWARTIELTAPVLQVLLLDSDRSGRVYVGAVVGHEDEAPPYPLIDEAIEVIRLASDGSPRGVLALPPLPAVDDALRPLSVDDTGRVLWMAALAAGLEVRAYEFPSQ